MTGGITDWLYTIDSMRVSMNAVAGCCYTLLCPESVEEMIGHYYEGSRGLQSYPVLRPETPPAT